MPFGAPGRSAGLLFLREAQPSLLDRQAGRWGSFWGARGEAALRSTCPAQDTARCEASRDHPKSILGFLITKEWEFNYSKPSFSGPDAVGMVLLTQY